MKKRILLLLFLVSLCTLNSVAQNKKQADTLHQDTSKLYQLELLQEYQQQQIDSIIKVRLEKELESVAGNVERARELEQQLQDINAKDSARKAEQLAKIQQLKKTEKGYPVAPFGDTLFMIFTRTGVLSAAERATAISGRISLLAKAGTYYPDSLQLLENESGLTISYQKDITIMTVTEFDALWYNKSPGELAGEYMEQIKKAVSGEREKNSLGNWLKRIGLALLVIGGVALLIKLIGFLFRLISKIIEKYRSRLLKGVSFGRITLMRPEHQERFIDRLLRLLRMVVTILTLYLSLPLLFNLFPETSGWAGTLLNWIVTPAKAILHNIVDFLPDLVTILMIYFFTSYIVKGLNFLTKEVEVGNMTIAGFHRDFARPTFNILRFVLYAFMLVIIFPYLPGSSSPAFQGVSVFLGLLISLGSTSAINNIIAGLVITYMRPFKIGDRVQIGDTIGDVMEKSMLVIRIRTIKNEDITVPNSTVLSSNTVNFSANEKVPGLVLHTTVTIGYDAPWKKVHKALTDAALRTSNILKLPAPFVLQTSLDDFYVSYQLNAYTDDANTMAVTYSELHQNIQDTFFEAGIEIMSPHYSSLRDGNNTTIPGEYLPKDYEAPAFNVRQQTGAKETGENTN